MANYDESKCLRAVSSVAKIDYGTHTIMCNKNATIGIHTQGKLDFLHKYCGWDLAYVSGITTTRSNNSSPEETRKRREAKKAAKEHQLKDKRK